MKLSFLLVPTVLSAACSVIPIDSECSLTDLQLEVLKPRVLSFLDAEWRSGGSECEEITSYTQYVNDFGCGVYGLPAGSSRSGCPDVLDGDYFVIFDLDTLEPTEIVLIAY